MATQTLYLASSVSGNLTNPNNALGNTPTTWAGAVNTNTSDLHTFRLGNPTSALGPGTQSITMRVRKGSNTNNPTVTARVLDGETVLANPGATTVTSTTGQDVTFTFTVPDGTNSQNLSFEYTMTASGGSGSARNSAQLAMVTWVADVAAPIVTLPKNHTYNDVFVGSSDAVASTARVNDMGNIPVLAGDIIAIVVGHEYEKNGSIYTYPSQVQQFRTDRTPYTVSGVTFLNNAIISWSKALVDHTFSYDYDPVSSSYFVTQAFVFRGLDPTKPLMNAYWGSTHSGSTVGDRYGGSDPRGYLTTLMTIDGPSDSTAPPLATDNSSGDLVPLTFANTGLGTTGGFGFSVYDSTVVSEYSFLSDHNYPKGFSFSGLNLPKLPAPSLTVYSVTNTGVLLEKDATVTADKWNIFLDKEYSWPQEGGVSILHRLSPGPQQVQVRYLNGPRVSEWQTAQIVVPHKKAVASASNVTGESFVLDYSTDTPNATNWKLVINGTETPIKPSGSTYTHGLPPGSYQAVVTYEADGIISDPASATIVVPAPDAPPGAVAKVFINGTWKAAKKKIFVGGTWQEAPAKIYIGGSWV